MIERYKGELIHILCSIRISCDKMTRTFTMDLVMSYYKHPHNLGCHNVLLESAYNLWAINSF